MDENNDDKKLDFAYFIQENLREYIKFCDTKAEIFLAVSSLLIGIILPWGNNENIRSQSVPWVLYIISVILLGVSFAAFFLSIFPRTKTGRPMGVIFWEHIRKQKKEDYLEKIFVIGANHILKELSGEAHEVSEIAHEKYKYVKFGVVLLGLSLLFMIILWFHIFPFPYADS